uniref:Signal recognition particle subunit SRP72 n=1 Tax=Pan troglodytes TaxID=9598 RepID=A0A2I3SAT2_PANTR
MYSHEEDIDSAIEVFTHTIQWCQNHWPKSPAHLSLIREAANFKLKYRQKKEAISDLEQQWKQNPKDFHTLTQLISAYSLVDPEKDKALCEHFMSLKVDVKALENSPGATYIWKKGVTPDPERWLPIQEHSYYRGRKKGKKDQIGKGIQGATAGASSELDARKTVSNHTTALQPGATEKKKKRKEK